MSDEVYYQLAKVLDTLPNGFPSTENGLEIKLLKKIFRPEDAQLFCDLRLQFETADQISQRTGRPVEGLEAHLTAMKERGQISGVELGGVKIFKMVPWVIGIYEYQLHRLDRELAELCEEYGKVFGPQFFNNGPALMQVVPIENEIRADEDRLRGGGLGQAERDEINGRLTSLNGLHENLRQDARRAERRIGRAQARVEELERDTL